VRPDATHRLGARTATAARGALAGAVLAALLLAPPVALLRWSRWPVTGVPNSEQLRDLPTTVVSDAALLATLTVALWAAWALFALCVLVEAVAEVRGRVARHLPAGPLQPLARSLVATVAMTIGSLALLPGAHAPPPAAAATAAQPAETSGPPAAPDVPQPAPPAPVAPDAGEPGVIEVVADDDPWTLAETHLGDGARWSELWDANRNRTQPDGERWTVGHHIEPGWTLVLPTTTLPPPGPPLITVAEADTAWDLAATHLGDPARWPELFDANRDRPQADGTTWSDPDVLRVGWQLTVPAAPRPTASPQPGHSGTDDASDAATPPQEADLDPSGAPTAPGPDAAGPTALPGDTELGVEQGEPSDSNQPVITPPRHDSGPTLDAAPPGAGATGTGDPPDRATPPTPPADPATREPPAPPASDTATSVAEPDTTARSGSEDNPAQPAGAEADDDGDGHDTEASTGALAAPLLGVAGTALAVALSRAWRRRRAIRAATLPTTTVPPPPPRSSRPTASEMLAADEPAADRLDAALANLAAGVRARSGQPCVQPRLVQVSPERIEVLMDRAEPVAPPPWRPEGSGVVWVLDGTDGTNLVVPDDPPPLPALVTIGAGESTLHLDLEAFGVVSLTGDPEACRGLARSIVTELAARADGTMAIEVVGDPLATAAGRLPGVRQVAGWDEVDPARAGRLIDELDAGRWPHTFAARASGRRAHAWVPFVWVTGLVDYPHFRDAVDTVARRPGASSVIVVVGDDAGAGLRIDLAAGGRFTIADLGLSGQAQRLDGPTLDQAADLLDDAEHVPVAQTLPFPAAEPASLTEPAHRRNGSSASETPVATDAAPLADGSDGYHDPDFDVLVRVCGDVHVEGGTERLANLETAVAVYVALQGETTVERIRDAIWNGTAVSHKRVRNVISNVRGTLSDAIRWVDEGRVAAGDSMITDLELIRRRLAYAARQTDPAAKASTLHGGLEWVTGRVCTYPSTAGWTWIDLENWIPQVESLVGTLACDLARLCLGLHDPEAACWAASQGIDATGQREHLTVLLARGYEQAGDAPAARAALASYLSYAAELGIDDHSDDPRDLLVRYPPAARSRAAS
jgi:nucleoid-associated protein YgaU